MPAKNKCSGIKVRYVKPGAGAGAGGAGGAGAGAGVGAAEMLVSCYSLLRNCLPLRIRDARASAAQEKKTTCHRIL